MATSRPTGDEPYLQATQPASEDTYYRPQVHRFESLYRREPANVRLARNKNPYAQPGLEQEAAGEQIGESMFKGGFIAGEAAAAFKAGQGLAGRISGSTARPFSAQIPGTQYTDPVSLIKPLQHDASAPKLSAKNVGKFMGRSGLNAGLTAVMDYGVDAATKESRQSIGEEIAAILKRKYGHEVDPITALTFYDQFMQNEGDLFHHKDVTTLGMQHDTAAGLMSMGVGSYNPVAGSAFNAARNVVERPGRMAQYEMLADRMNSEVTAGDVRNAAMRQYAGKYGVEGVKKRFPTLGWETWKPTGNE